MGLRIRKRYVLFLVLPLTSWVIKNKNLEHFLSVSDTPSSVLGIFNVSTPLFLLTTP